MDKQIVTFRANNGQDLWLTSEFKTYAANTINYIEAHFLLGDHWREYQRIMAVWYTDLCQRSSEIDSNGITIIPAAVLTRPGILKMNLCADTIENDVLTARMTSYPVKALELARNHA